ncbi:MAG: ferritin-like domain-containing protein [Calothrix sp. C42_A2020_038]|nr:ferritin-like domain-containing protein [Calothrix sp. C42_A2020_038]
MNHSNNLNQKFSRRKVVVSGAIAGFASAFVPLIGEKAEAQSKSVKRNDVKILNNALYYEHQAVWAYSFAAGKLTNTNVGKAVLALALRNQADHKKHRDVLAAAVRSLGGTPVQAESSYDVSSYIKKGEGNIDNDVNIAKLALALEVDAAIAYTLEAAQLKTPKLITAGASIGTNESAHAAAIRATFRALGVNIEIVPAAFVSMENRNAWILKV